MILLHVNHNHKSQKESLHTFYEFKIAKYDLITFIYYV
jgi:hypothetical protein